MRKPALRHATPLACAAMLIAVFGCGGPDVIQFGETAKGPAWINEPLLGVDKAERANVFAAVGMCADLKNPALTQKTAMLRARTEIANTIQTRVDAMLKDWMASSQDFANPESQTSKQFTESVSRGITSVTMQNTRQRNKWFAPSGTLYVLVTAPRDASFYKTAADRVREQLEAMAKDMAFRADPKAAAERFKEYAEAQAKKEVVPEEPKPEAPKPEEPKKDERVSMPLPKTSGPAPQWLAMGKHPAYPRSQYLTGIGVRTLAGNDTFIDGQKGAEVDAYAALGKEISVNVKQKFQDEINSQMVQRVGADGGVKNQGTVKTLTRVLSQSEVNIDVQAGQVVDRYYDAGSRTHYCLVAANRAKWATALVAEISRHRLAGQKFYAEGRRGANAGQFMHALKQFFKALNEFVEGIKSESILNVVRPPGWQPSHMLPKPEPTAADAVVMADRLLSGLSMQIVGGNEQQGSPGKPLPKKLKVRLVYSHAGKLAPAGSVAIRFSPTNVQPGKIALEPALATTDSNGIAECTVTRADYDGQSQHLIEALPAFEELFPGVTSLALPKATFTYRLLTPTSTRIAVRIAEFVDGKPTGQRSYTESKVVGALVKAGFQVVDQSKLPDASAMRNATDAQVVKLMGQVADVAVVGEVHANFKEKLDQLFGRPINPPQVFYQGRRAVRVINVHTGERLVSLDDMGQAQKVGALSAQDAARRTFLKIGPPTGAEIAQAITKLFPKE